jgi:hypothetical protein
MLVLGGLSDNLGESFDYPASIFYAYLSLYGAESLSISAPNYVEAYIAVPVCLSTHGELASRMLFETPVFSFLQHFPRPRCIGVAQRNFLILLMHLFTFLLV